MKKVLTIAALVLMIAFSTKAAAKEIKTYLGEWYVSTYSVSDNTPAGSRATSSGARATEGVTVAVDMHNPLVPMGSIVEIEGFGRRIVQDVGGFGYMNGGCRAFDVFTYPGEGGLFVCKCYLIHKETAAEKAKRLKRERKARQKKQMILAYDPTLAPYQVRTYRGVVKCGTIRLRSRDMQISEKWLDVVQSKKGDKRIIYTGNRRWCERPVTWLEEVCEGVKG